MSTRIVVLGAGPTGLGAAHRLGEIGHDDWDVYEACDHVGGLAASHRDEHGFIWDHGGHVIFSHYAYFDDLVERMLPGEYDEHVREAWVWTHGRYVPYPFQNNIHRLPPEAFIDCVMGIAGSNGDVRRGNFDAWIESVFGAGIAEHFMRPYNEKVWAHPLDTLGVDWQGDRVPVVDLRRILQHHLTDRDDVSWGPNSVFKFPLLGTGMLYDRIANSLPRPVRLAKRAVAIDAVLKRVTFADSTGDHYDKLVTTLPLTELVRIVDACPADVVAAAGELRSTEGLFVGVGVADPCPSSKCWVYFPEPDIPFYRVTFLSNYSPKVTPGEGYFSLLAEVSSSEHRPEAADTVVERTIEAMVTCGLLTVEQARSRIVSRQLLRVPYSYPVPTLGRDRALACVQSWLASHEIYSRGRFGAWRYEIGNTDHSVMMGVEVVDHLVLGRPEVTWGLLPGEEARRNIA